MVCLEEIMSFRHFFQALSIFNMLHMVVGGVVGSALYSRGLSYFIADNTARYGAAADNVPVSADPAGYAAACGQFMSDITEISIKSSMAWPHTPLSCCACFSCCMTPLSDVI